MPFLNLGTPNAIAFDSLLLALPGWAETASFNPS
jgi:hypothetical protein